MPAGSTLLEAVVAAGLPIARACDADGLCGRCGVRVLAGGARLGAEGELETRSKERNRLDPGLRLACRVRIEGDLEVTASYW